MIRKQEKMLPYVLLAVLTLLACWLFAGRHGMFASKTDWISQHSVFPDYFRRLFYETGELFPEFAANLGGGQNIYHFSYYGLFSPVILPSYLLPFIKMSDYLMAVSILCLAASGMLLYAWLKTCGLSTGTCLASAVMLILASPMVYQSYRQVMFVNYMPFLCMAFIGAERYWKNGKTGLYTAGMFLMIMTSFYFSIAGIAALMLYGMGRYRKVPWKRPLLHFLFPVLAAVSASGILLLPTAYVLMARSGSSSTHSIRELLLPDFSAVRFACSGYGIGLTTGILAILLTGLSYKDRGKRLLSAACLAVVTIPFFSWLFNGGLYARDKALIPFLPLLCYLTAVYLEKLKQKKLSFCAGLAGYVLAVFWCLASFLLHNQGISTKRYGFLLFESILLLVFFLIYWKRRSFLLLVLPSIACLILFGIKLNNSEGDRIEKSRYDSVTDQTWESDISALLSKDQGFYRLEQDGSNEEKKDNINRIWDMRQWITSVYASAYQEDYQNFREHVFHAGQPFRNQFMQAASDNPLFRKLMGVKYIVKRTGPSGKAAADIQEHAAPVIYATDRLMSQKQYEKLPFPYNQTALMQYAAVGSGKYAADGFRPEAADIMITSKDNGFQKESDGYSIQSKKDVRAWLSVPGDTKYSKKERLLYLQFDVRNNRKNRDVAITLNGFRNRLSAKNHIYYNRNTTFTYVVLLPADLEKAEVLFGNGDYAISNIKSFLSDTSILSEDSLYQSEFQADWAKTGGNRISGRITVKNTGYLITSIPYDRGFTIKIDGKPVPIQKVNTAFLGAPVSAGNHQIEIIYHAPGLQTGKLVSVIGVALWAALYRMRIRSSPAA